MELNSVLHDAVVHVLEQAAFLSVTGEIGYTGGLVEVLENWFPEGPGSPITVTLVHPVGTVNFWVPEDLALLMASNMLGEDLSGDGGLPKARDAVCEMVNMVMGLVPQDKEGRRSGLPVVADPLLVKRTVIQARSKVSAFVTLLVEDYPLAVVLHETDE